jgi:hypothetical protein
MIHVTVAVSDINTRIIQFPTINRFLEFADLQRSNATEEVLRELAHVPYGGRDWYLIHHFRRRGEGQPRPFDAILKIKFDPGFVRPSDLTAEDFCENFCENLYYLQELVLPRRPFYLRDEALLNCFSLKEIVWSKGHGVIGFGAFRNCISLTSIIIPHGVTHVRPRAFAQCISLIKLDIPDTVASIAPCFTVGMALRDVNIPDSLSLESVNVFRPAECVDGITFTIRPVKNRDSDLARIAVAYETICLAVPRLSGVLHSAGGLQGLHPLAVQLRNAMPGNKIVQGVVNACDVVTDALVRYNGGRV